MNPSRLCKQQRGERGTEPRTSSEDILGTATSTVPRLYAIDPRQPLVGQGSRSPPFNSDSMAVRCQGPRGKAAVTRAKRLHASDERSGFNGPPCRRSQAAHNHATDQENTPSPPSRGVQHTTSAVDDSTPKGFLRRPRRDLRWARVSEPEQAHPQSPPPTPAELFPRSQPFPSSSVALRGAWTSKAWKTRGETNVTHDDPLRAQTRATETRSQVGPHMPPPCPPNDVELVSSSVGSVHA